MKLHILRHAKTEVNSLSGKDIDRKLAIKGMLQTDRLRVFFSKHTFSNTLFFSSTSTRTRETILNALSNDIQASFVFSDLLYLANEEQLLHFIFSQDDCIDLFIVGHNEGLSNLVSLLSRELICLKTGEYVCLSFDCYKWSDVIHYKAVLS